MVDWWTRIGLQVSGKNDLQIAAREAVLREFVPDWFRSRHARLSLVGLAYMIAVSDRQVRHARAGSRSPQVGLTLAQAELETLEAHDAVPHDVWTSIARDLAAVDSSYSQAVEDDGN